MYILTDELEQQILNLWPSVRDSAFKDESVLAEFIAMPVDELWAYHFGLGLHVRNNYLYPNEELRQQFIVDGILNADEMSSVMMRKWHKALSEGIIN